LQLWKVPNRTHVVYPPCDTATLCELPLRGRQPLVISIGQFRPEKDHRKQIDAFALFLERWRQGGGGDLARPRLALIGGCRGAADEARVAELRRRVQELGVQDSVEFGVNVEFATLQAYLSKALVGLHTMWNEHFGIGVVEYMAAGVITIAHNSGGPRADIVVETADKRTGFLAATAEEYANQLFSVFASVFKSGDELLALRENARRYSQSFSDEEFLAELGKWIAPLVLTT